jgi:vancomycin resistance protein YoaR
MSLSSLPQRFFMLAAAAPLVLLGLLSLGGALLAGFLAAQPAAEIEIAGYATTLQGRTRSQRHNARLAAQAIDGKVIAPGATFSFNQSVKSWSADQGYVKAPVSFDGELVPAFGGGVCQTSTTLYNAALLAGLPIRERHPHVFAPTYIAPGRDAAVAYPNVDLRFANSYPWPLRIRAQARGDRLDVRLLGKERPAFAVHLVPHLLSRIAPARLTRVTPDSRSSDAGTPRALRSPGASGYRVVTYRVLIFNGATRRERLSDDTYPAMNRVVHLSQDEAPQP